jgi:uncharacterized iron-regulated membrane protein
METLRKILVSTLRQGTQFGLHLRNCYVAVCNVAVMMLFSIVILL